MKTMTLLVMTATAFVGAGCESAEERCNTARVAAHDRWAAYVTVADADYSAAQTLDRANDPVALHLVGYVRALDVEGDAVSLVARRQSVDRIVQDTRTRHKRLLDRIATVEKKFAPINKAADVLQGDLDALSRGVVALRLNALLFAGSIEMLRQLGETAAYTAVLDDDLDRLVAQDDEWLVTVLRRVHDSVMSLSTVMSYKATDAKTRMGLAARVWTGARAAARVRSEFGRAREGAEREPPRLLLSLGEGRAVASVAWLDDAAEGVATVNSRRA